MELDDFLRALRDLDGEEVRRLAADLAAAGGSPAEAVAMTRARLAVEHAVRRDRHRDEASWAAHLAGEAVLDAARRSGFELPDDAVTAVARSAAQVARGLVAGPAAAGEVGVLARGLRSLRVDVGAGAAR